MIKRPGSLDAVRIGPREGRTGARACMAALLGLAAWSSGVEVDLAPNKANSIAFDPMEARYVRVVIGSTSGGGPCLDEFEVYGPTGDENLALAMNGAMATASSCLPVLRVSKPSLDAPGDGDADLDLGSEDALGSAADDNLFKIANLNDGEHGNNSSWVAAGEAGEWAEIELARPTTVSRVVLSRDRGGRLKDRMPVEFEVRASLDARSWATVAKVTPKARPIRAKAAAPQIAAGVIPNPARIPLIDPSDEAGLLKHTFACEAASWWNYDHKDPIQRVFTLMQDMQRRFERKGLDVAAERLELAALKERKKSLTAGAKQPADSSALQALWLEARMAKRRLMLRDPDLEALSRVLFVKRHPLLPSHNYSDMFDSRFNGGGGVCVLEIPRQDGRLMPAAGHVATLFDAGEGIPRDAVLDYSARTVVFAHRPPGPIGAAYWHLMRMNADGSNCRQITDGPYHDYYPCVLPDDSLVFVTTRCRARFLCWKPQTMVLYRLDADGSNMKTLSFANLSEWGPSMMRDGRVLWTRSEYQDKGADYGHTLWAMRPDGSHPELVFGNNTTHCLMNGREVPGTSEICATLISHFGDFNGPIALIKPNNGLFVQGGPNVITPDLRGIGNGGRFRDPYPVSSEYVLVSHNPSQRFGLYVIDRYGNREVIYMDGAYGSMCPAPFRPRQRPPVLADTAEPRGEAKGRFVVANVYAGLGPGVKLGSVKYIRVCEELRSTLERREDGQLREVYQDFMNHYASPMEAGGPSGWPTYVAKAVHGLAPVAEDGSAYFEAPAGKVLYFQALDEDLNEIQRMRSVVQLQPGEVRSCVGCHEDRLHAPPQKRTVLPAQPAKLQPPPWGAGPFAYQEVVQPILDKRCVSCHAATHKKRINLTGMAANNSKGKSVPVSYQTLLKGGWVHHFNCGWHQKHSKAEPLTFGTVKSPLWAALAEKHKDLKLTRDEIHAIKCWTDLNCPLWTDYVHRSQRAELACAAGACPQPPSPGAPAAPRLEAPREAARPAEDVPLGTLLDDLELD